MKNVMIKLDSIIKVKEFVNIANKYDDKIEVISGRSIVDGKSMMGIFTLDLQNNLILKIRTEEKLHVLIQELQPYIVA